MSSTIGKAVILARGLGTRMRRADPAVELEREQVTAAEAGLKAMIPVGRPFLDYVLSGLADAGYREMCLVIGPEHNIIRDYYLTQPLRRVSLRYAIQPEARGTADAVLAAEAFAGGEEFLVMNGDNYYPVKVLRKLRAFQGPGTILFEAEGLIRNSNIAADRVRQYAYAEVSGEELVALVEKPAPEAEFPPNALVSMNLWRFSRAIFEHCRRVERSSRGEYELSGAVNRAIQNGARFRVETTDLGVLDLSRREDVAVVTDLLRGIEVAL